MNVYKLDYVVELKCIYNNILQTHHRQTDEHNNLHVYMWKKRSNKNTHAQKNMHLKNEIHKIQIINL